MFSENIVVAFAFGSPAHITPNILIAERALVVSDWGKKFRIFSQYDVPLQKYSGIHFLDSGSSQISTLDLIQRLYKELTIVTHAPHNTITVKLVAAPPHKSRVIRDLLNMGFDVEDASRIWYTKYPPSIWYDRSSTQLRTRHPLFWWPREIFLRALPWKLYKKLTTSL